MNLYKLIQYFKNYINPKGIQALVEIKLQTAQKWLYKFGFEYKDMKKDVFVDGYKQPDVIKD